MKKFPQFDPQFIDYREIISGKINLETKLSAQSVLRIESPDEDLDLERILIKYGENFIHEVPSDTDIHTNFILPAENLDQIPMELGRIISIPQWFAGFTRLMHEIKNSIVDIPPRFIFNHPDDILIMFDKVECKRRLIASGIPTPIGIEPLISFEQLIEVMDKNGWKQVFIKPRFGSGASGIMAFRKREGRMIAYSTVEIAENPPDKHIHDFNFRFPKYYNSKKLQVYEDLSSIQQLVNFMAFQRCFIELWIPKAGVNGQVFDIRQLLIDRKPCHTVIRCANRPMTNLHLDNDRHELNYILPLISPSNWDAGMVTVGKISQIFPRSFYSGVDLAFLPGFKRHAVFEVNAFGDLLLDSMYYNQSPYHYELSRLIEKMEYKCGEE